jgi:acyl dehydratase
MAATIWQHKGCLYILLLVTHPKGVRPVVAHARALPKLYVEDVHVGSILPMLVKASISPMQSVRYADVSGTFNLLHTDLQLAK